MADFNSFTVYQYQTKGKVVNEGPLLTAPKTLGQARNELQKDMVCCRDSFTIGADIATSIANCNVNTSISCKAAAGVGGTVAMIFSPFVKIGDGLSQKVNAETSIQRENANSQLLNGSVELAMVAAAAAGAALIVGGLAATGCTEEPSYGDGTTNCEGKDYSVAWNVKVKDGFAGCSNVVRSIAREFAEPLNETGSNFFCNFGKWEVVKLKTLQEICGSDYDYLYGCYDPANKTIYLNSATVCAPMADEQAQDVQKFREVFPLYASWIKYLMQHELGHYGEDSYAIWHGGPPLLPPAATKYGVEEFANIFAFIADDPLGGILNSVNSQNLDLRTSLASEVLGLPKELVDEARNSLLPAQQLIFSGEKVDHLKLDGYSLYGHPAENFIFPGSGIGRYGLPGFASCNDMGGTLNNGGIKIYDPYGEWHSPLMSAAYNVENGTLMLIDQPCEDGQLMLTIDQSGEYKQDRSGVACELRLMSGVVDPLTQYLTLKYDTNHSKLSYSGIFGKIAFVDGDPVVFSSDNYWKRDKQGNEFIQDYPDSLKELLQKTKTSNYFKSFSYLSKKEWSHMDIRHLRNFQAPLEVIYAEGKTHIWIVTPRAPIGSGGRLYRAEKDNDGLKFTEIFNVRTNSLLNSPYYYNYHSISSNPFFYGGNWYIASRCRECNPALAAYEMPMLLKIEGNGDKLTPIKLSYSGEDIQPSSAATMEQPLMGLGLDFPSLTVCGGYIYAYSGVAIEKKDGTKMDIDSSIRFTLQNP